jgi:aspartyl protease family protein
MQKLVFTMLVCGVAVGAMMPNGTLTAEPRAIEAPRAEELVASEEAPDSAFDLGTGEISLQRASDGHFYAEAEVNGMPVNFLVDTGASGIALAHADAQRAAVVMAPSMDEIVGNGASGPVKGQFVQLERLNLGIKEMRGVDAVVLDGGAQSLLGQSVLAQFGSVTIEGDRMVLR